jgi:membrane protein implicated in regulation of membrane protease activity
VVYVYLAAAIVGCVLLVASLFGAGHGHDAGHDASSDGEHVSPAFALLSVRVWTYVLAFGGVTGLLLRWVAPVAEPWRALLAVFVGAVAATIARVVIARVVRGGPSGMVRTAELAGRTAGVVVPFTKGATGKVRLRVADSDVDLLATTDDGEPLDRDEEVLIVEMRDDGSALVTRSPK